MRWPEVDFFVAGQRRSLADEVAAFDQDVRGSKGDVLAALRVDGEKADVGPRFADGFDRAPGGVEDHQFERHAQALGEGARQVDRDAENFAAAAVASGEQRIAEVDRGAQNPLRGKVGAGGSGGHGGS